jgi:glycosyltransferase involved in cell wall biosynthesis
LKKKQHYRIMQHYFVRGEPLIAISAIVAFILLLMWLEVHFGLRSIQKLERVAATLKRYPKISIIITAKDEEAAIPETLQRIAQLDYPNLEIICVNDRSEDQTGDLIERFSKKDGRVKALHISQLPEGWMGKNHAAHCASKQATGEWLLFLDADVQLESDMLKRIMTHIHNRSLDHVTVLFHYLCSGIIYNIFHIAHKAFGFVVGLKPWMARVSASKRSINIGHFCLVNKSVYEQCGGHQAVAMECLEDVRFGELIKKHGFKQEAISCQNHAKIEWYATWQEMFIGIRKNSFAFFHYKLPPVILGTLGWIALFVVPFFAMLLTRGYAQLGFGIAVFFLYSIAFEACRFFKMPMRFLPLLPIGLIIHLWPMYASVFYFYKNKGICWRGTFYSAEQLRNPTR